MPYKWSLGTAVDPADADMPTKDTKSSPCAYSTSRIHAAGCEEQGSHKARLWTWVMMTALSIANSIWLSFHREI